MTSVVALGASERVPIRFALRRLMILLATPVTLHSLRSGSMGTRRLCTLGTIPLFPRLLLLRSLTCGLDLLGSLPINRLCGRTLDLVRPKARTKISKGRLVQLQPFLPKLLILAPSDESKYQKFIDG